MEKGFNNVALSKGGGRHRKELNEAGKEAVGSEEDSVAHWAVGSEAAGLEADSEEADSEVDPGAETGVVGSVAEDSVAAGSGVAETAAVDLAAADSGVAEQVAGSAAVGSVAEAKDC